MIEPTEQDVGRGVVYQAGHPGALLEQGTLKSFNAYTVFVLYQGDMQAKGTDREDLRWLCPSRAT